ncbi:MAG: HU family DNA-binding protein [Tannerellaceae bacterium]|jgi:nucleoid DNA-binding protein|nr:HU family DNA-binding protein [Tannerellaceae bacterium]
MNSRISTSDLASQLAQASGKDAEQSEKFLREFIGIVDEGLFADRLVRVNSIGTFKIILVEKRESIDVNTKERILIPEHFKLSFLPDKEMRSIVNKPFEAFDTVQIEEGTDLESLRTTQDRETDDDADEPDTDEILRETAPVREEPPTTEIAQEANEEDHPTVIIMEEIPPIPEEEDDAPPPIPEEAPEESLTAETAVLPEDEMLPMPAPLIPPIPPPPDPPPPEDPDEPEDEHENNSGQPDYNDIYNDKKNTEQNNLKEEYMDNFNGNRRKPGPVPYGPGTGGSLTNNVAAVILAVVIVVLVIVLAFMLLKPTKSKSGSGDIDRSEVFSLPSQNRDLDANANGLGGTIEDEPFDEPITPDPAPVTEPKSGKKAPSKTKAAPYVAQSSITTTKGDRLNLIALKYYGDKVFWVYIYIANQTKLQNPDILPVGLTLTVPASNEYDINRYSSLSLRKAYALQRDILNNKNSFGAASTNGASPRSNQYDQYGNGQYGNGNEGYDYGSDYGSDYGNDNNNGSGEYGGDSGAGDYGSTGDYGSESGQDDDLGSYGSESFDDGGFEGAKATNKKPATGKSSITNRSVKSVTARPAAPGRYL